jgi:hypothetical protein
VQPVAEEPEAAPDLMAALEASLAAVRGDDGDGGVEKPAKRTRKAKSSANGGSGTKKPAKTKT